MLDCAVSFRVVDANKRLEREEFCEAFEVLEKLRNSELSEYRGYLNEKKFAANNLRTPI